MWTRTELNTLRSHGLYGLLPSQPVSNFIIFQKWRKLPVLLRLLLLCPVSTRSNGDYQVFVLYKQNTTNQIACFNQRVQRIDSGNQIVELLPVSRSLPEYTKTFHKTVIGDKRCCILKRSVTFICYIRKIQRRKQKLVVGRAANQSFGERLVTSIHFLSTYTTVSDKSEFSCE